LMKQSLTESTNASMPQCLNQSINQSMKMIWNLLKASSFRANWFKIDHSFNAVYPHWTHHQTIGHLRMKRCGQQLTWLKLSMDRVNLMKIAPASAFDEPGRSRDLL
jgi:hypothetical protein